MKRTKVLIATPVHRMPNPRMEASKRAVMATTQRTKPSYAELRNESLISRARNTLLTTFLASDNEYLYFWDDDIETLNIGGKAGNLLDMLVSHDEPIVGGLYATRNMGGHCAGRVLEGTKPNGRLWQVEYLAGGSMLIHRDAVVCLIQGYPMLKYEPRSNEGATGAAYAFFQPMIHCGEYLSEDFAFCQRWLDMGATRIHADLDVKLWHWGEAPYSIIDPRHDQAQIQR